MPTLRFSRRTVIAAVELMETRLNHSQLTRFLLKLGPLFPDLVGETGSLATRLNNLIAVYDQAPDREIDAGELLQDALVEHAVSFLPTSFLSPEFQTEGTMLPDDMAIFVRSLELDGYVATAGIIRRTLPTDLGLPEAESEITRLLLKHDLHTANGHLNQAIDAHARGDWAAANGQIRTFLDALLDMIAEKIDPSSATLSSGQPRRARLAALGFLSRSINEWEDNGLGFINGLLKRLHPQGAHPGLSDEDDSTFRLHIVLLTAKLLLVRFDAGRWALPR